MALAQSLLIASGRETLPESKRQKFTVAKINPFKGLALLFTNGPGLRRLALSGAFFTAVQTIYATFDPFRLGPIGWTPAEQSYYSAALSGVNIASTQLVSKPLLSKLGARRTFELSSLAMALAYVGLSQSCRPAGQAAQLRRTVQFLLFKTVLMTPWSEPARFAVLPMVVRQAQAVAPRLGRGEVTAAQGALENLGSTRRMHVTSNAIVSTAGRLILVCVRRVDRHTYALGNLLSVLCSPKSLTGCDSRTWGPLCDGWVVPCGVCCYTRKLPF